MSSSGCRWAPSWPNLLSRPFPGSGHSLGCVVVMEGQLVSYTVGKISVVGGSSSQFKRVVRLFAVLLATVLVDLFFTILILINGVRNATQIIGCTNLIHNGARLVIGLRVSNAPRSTLLNSVTSCVRNLHFNDDRLSLIQLSSTSFRTGVATLSDRFSSLEGRLVLIHRHNCTRATVVTGDRRFFRAYSRTARLTRICSRGQTATLSFLRGIVLTSVIKLLFLFNCRVFGTLQCTTVGHVLRYGICLSRTANLPGGGGYRRLLSTPSPPSKGATLYIFSLGGLHAVGGALNRSGNSRCVHSFTRRLHLTIPSRRFINHSNNSRFVTVLCNIS